jgi:VIT1/CCC1 family predicted Fe2+/Mn2+ transporter
MTGGKAAGGSILRKVLWLVLAGATAYVVAQLVKAL